MASREALIDSPSMAIPAEAKTIGRVRLESVDVLRGVIMIIMALDHVRDYFGDASANPANLTTTTTALFFTRWITHFCAPVFFLLTGTGAFLSLKRKSSAELSRFLLTRGLWLIFLELTLFRCLALQFNFDYHVTLLNVLWALGWSMITLSALVRLRVEVIAGFGVAMIALHNLLDPVPASTFGPFAPVWSILHVPGALFVGSNRFVLEAYPLIPWIGVTAVGFALGRIFNYSRERRRAWMWRLGIGLSAAFVVLRTANLYGDPARWSAQKTPLFTFLSFLNTTKYPPSLLFLLMTLGPALLLLWAVEAQVPRWLTPALTIGKVPLFYFLLHFVLIHVLAVAICYARYGAIHWMFESPTPAQFPFTQPEGWPLSLPLIYLIWIGVVLAMYPVCRWFAGVKQRRNEAWLSYF